MDWNNIISFVAGGLIAIIPVIIANRYQARERDKEREEQRREAKIQSRQKWIERDILKIMELIEGIIKSLSEFQSSKYLLDDIEPIQKTRTSTKRQVLARIAAYYYKLSGAGVEARQTSSMIRSLVYSFEDDNLVDVYSDFAHATMEYFEKKNKSYKRTEGGITKLDSEVGEDSASAEWEKVTRNAGEFQKLLREKLISIRE